MSAAEKESDLTGITSLRQHCFEILTSGYPQAFKEFFELTHTPTTDETQGRGPYGEAQLLPSISKVLLRSCLVAAEAAARKGEMGSVYLAYRELAEHFEASEQQPPAIEYYCKCLEIARDANHRGLQIEAYERLGAAHERNSDLPQAIAFFEKQAALAQSDTDVRRATAHLREVYWKRAEELEREKNYEGALSNFQQVAEAARTLDDARWAGQACYRLGLLLTRTDDASAALPHLHQYRDICQHDGDRVGEGQACCALAEAYQMVGDTSQALEHLEAFLAVAVTAEPALQARACCSLGVIYAQQGERERSLAYLEQFFALACTTADRAMIDAARTHLGRARAHLSMGTFMSAVERADASAESLLGWKLDRAPLQAGATPG